jgi:hypothetical protein
VIAISLVFIVGTAQLSKDPSTYSLTQASLAVQNGSTAPALEQRLVKLTQVTKRLIRLGQIITTPSEQDRASAYYFLGRLQQHRAEQPDFNPAAQATQQQAMRSGPGENYAALLDKAMASYKSCMALRSGLHSRSADAAFYLATAKVLRGGPDSVKAAKAIVEQMSERKDPHIYIDYLMWTADSRYAIRIQFDTADIRKQMSAVLGGHLSDKNFPDAVLEQVVQEMKVWCLRRYAKGS